MIRKKQKSKTKLKDTIGFRAKVALALYVLGMVTAFTIFVQTDGSRTLILSLILVLAPLAALLYIVYLFRPINTDKLGVALWLIAGTIIFSILHSIIIFLLFLQSFRFT